MTNQSPLLQRRPDLKYILCLAQYKCVMCQVAELAEQHAPSTWYDKNDKAIYTAANMIVELFCKAIQAVYPDTIHDKCKQYSAHFLHV